MDILDDFEDESDRTGQHMQMLENAAAFGMTEAEWRRLVMRRLTRQDVILNRIAKSLNVVAGVRLGGTFARWIAPVGVLLIAAFELMLRLKA